MTGAIGYARVSTDEQARENNSLAAVSYTHLFRPGHRIMVQVQSTLFPLYDRNPQTWVSNIFFAKPGDFQKATVSIERGSAGASAILLPVVKVSTAQP